MTLEVLRLRVQIIDMQPRQIDVDVPAYIPADDLSQRVIRDAGLQSHWSTGYRRNYYVRARGRVLAPKETLESVGLVDGELIYLLPEVDVQKGVLEQNPEYPEVRPYLGQGITQLVMVLVLLLVYASLWGMALTTSTHWVVTIAPSLGVSVICVSFARHAWGGRAFSWQVGVTALVLYLIALIPPFFAPSLQQGFVLAEFAKILAPGIIIGFAGIIVSWIAWWGSVEPLHQQSVEIQRTLEQQVTFTCGICARAIEPQYDSVCEYNPQCGKHFHKGCVQAKVASYQGDPRLCPVCTVRLM